ncbi:MAG: hypothetical protein QF554_11425, partial [Dehalococcoidia bacterium]|nr:hypothetical protein [Dehalococcoidia bacterium]
MPSERVQRQIELLLDQAEAALAEGDWSAVIERVRGVLAVDPEHEDALSIQSIAEAAGGNTAPRRAEAVETPAQPASTTETPVSFANDRYQVSEFPGEGGKKRVYLAHDTLLDREVAFALIKTEGFDQTSKERIS